MLPSARTSLGVFIFERYFPELFVKGIDLRMKLHRLGRVIYKHQFKTASYTIKNVRNLISRPEHFLTLLFNFFYHTVVLFRPFIVIDTDKE